MGAVNSQMLKGVLSLLLLHLLNDQEDYGYNVVVRLREKGFGELTEGSVYPALTRLEGQGLLESRLVKSSSGPARKYYSTTAAGVAELHASRTEWAALVGSVARVLDTREGEVPCPS